jgi:hypothetical protein
MTRRTARTQGPKTEKLLKARELDHCRARAERTPHLASGGADINTQLAQARELVAKLAKEYGVVRLLRASIAGEASA